MIIYRHPSAGGAVPPWLAGCGDGPDDRRMVARRAAAGGALVGVLPPGELILPAPGEGTDWIDLVDGWQACLLGSPTDPTLVRKDTIYPVELIAGIHCTWACPVLYDPTGAFAFPREIERRDGRYQEAIPSSIEEIASIGRIVREAIMEGRYGELTQEVGAEWTSKLVAAANHVAPELLGAPRSGTIDQAMIHAALLTCSAAKYCVEDSDADG